ncbi:KISS1R [Mytilus edulis]|uniref:KISS1R n=1 Tax=Mytilus edulis TaxID=6550 RepID=A0A8S3SEM4_MYTED|nr:KISS1R [Mytilus edulis]
MSTVQFNSTVNPLENITWNLAENRIGVFVIAITEAVIIILLNVLLLGLCIKVPIQNRNQLHIIYTFLAVSDLMNGIYLLPISATFFFVHTYIFRYYYVCLSIMTLNSVGTVTTGYLLLLLTAIKCFSVVYPLKSLRYITRKAAISLAAATYIFSYAIIIIPTIVWGSRTVAFMLEKECDIKKAYRDNHKQFLYLAYALSGGFVAGVLVFNSIILIKIAKRTRIGVQENINDTDITSVGFRLSNKPSEEVRTIRINEVPNTTDLTGRNSSNIRSGKPSATKACWQKEEARKYGFRKSKNFKAYLTVLMHVGIYLLNGFPFFIISANKNLKVTYYDNNRNVRFGCNLLLFLTSLTNPILTILRVPGFNKTLRQVLSKIFKPKH